MKNKRERVIERKNYIDKVSLPNDRNFRNMASITGLALAVDAFQSLFTGELFIYGKPIEQAIQPALYAMSSLGPLYAARMSEEAIKDSKNKVKALEYGLDKNDFDSSMVEMASDGPTNWKEAFSDFFYEFKKDK
ncbi:hypothetical protein GOV13_03680 [Candidatus Pacearchaeota archaeon]|nr:hypothetical protein [Candidatus Pacearchaeota archaeon]